MDTMTTPTSLIIIGISGDLSRRKLLPAIREIAKAGVLPEAFRIIGISRRELSLDEILPASGDNQFLLDHLTLRQMDLDDQAAYEALGTYLADIEAQDGKPGQRLYYLSVPPNASQDIVELLGKSGLSNAPNTKLLLEKPFGTDMDSAQALIDHIHGHFDEEQVYRIDHYLAKEMAQNLVIFRSGNSLFKRTWNSTFIESIHITMTEQIGIEGRAGFYEQTGALRDIIQSHLLQLAALTLMELPPKDDWQSIPARRLEALSRLVPPTDVATKVVRAQYRSYKEEVDNPNSAVETFVSVPLQSEDPNWEGVPITLTTGKALSETATEIVICYRRDDVGESNTLVLRIQPDEGVELTLWAKEPGYSNQLKKVPLNFLYSDHFSGLPEAYERVFVDAMRSDHSLFASSEEVLASWRILKPIQEHWAQAGDQGLLAYESRAELEDILNQS
jgi:glucose-6-phosphate 1-dehydrogenase